MRILWVKMGGLWPPTAGGRIRSVEIVSALARRNEVTLVTTQGPGDDAEGLARRLPHCRVLTIPFAAPRLGSPAFAGAVARSWLSPLPVDLWKWQSTAVRDRVQSLIDLEPPDICVADFLVSLANIPRQTPVPLVLFEHNVEFIIWRRLAAVERRPWRRALLEVEWRKMRSAERRAWSKADVTVAVSESDRKTIASLTPRSRTASIATGVDTSFFKPGWRPERPHRLVFTGSMDWYPNEDAVLYFGAQVLPLIRAEVPDVTFTVVGRHPGPQLRANAEPMGFVLTGTVDDIRPYVDEAAVYVVPLRAGGGTRLKIFEALAMAKAVVSTTVGAEGLGLTHDRDVVIADDPRAFARAVIALFADPVKRQALGDAGRRLVETRYSWETVANEFESHCQSLLDDGAAVRTPSVDRLAYFPKSLRTAR